MRTLALASLVAASLACAPERLSTVHDAPSPGDVAADVTATPDASAPDAATPDAQGIDATQPDAAQPDAATPDVSAPDAASPDVSAPDVSAPDVATPDVVTPDVSAPDAATPDASTMRDLAAAGPHRVTTWNGTISGTQGNARVYYPTTAGAERFPLVVFAHGFQLEVNFYEQLLTHVASWGYVVASVDYPGNILMVDHRAVPAALIAARRAFMGGLAGFPASARVDASRTIAMGHSLGGKGAIMAVLQDADLLAGLALDPVDDNPAPFGRITDATPSVTPERMGSLRRALGLFGATQSRCARLGQTCAPESSDYRQFATAVPMGVPVAVWPLRDFGHMDFVDACMGFTCGTCSGGGAPLDSRRAALRALTVAFLERYARNDASMQPWLDGAQRAALVSAGVLWNGTPANLPACR